MWIIKPFFGERREQNVNQNARVFIAEVNFQYMQWRDNVRGDYRQAFNRDEILNIPGTLYEKMLVAVKNFSNCGYSKDELMKQVCFSGRNYHPSELWKAIAKATLRPEDRKRINYRLTESFDEIKLDEQSALPILIALLICEGKTFQQQWGRQIEHRIENWEIEEDEASFLKKKGLIVLYMLVLESDENYRMSEENEKIYMDLWMETVTSCKGDLVQCKKVQTILWEILWEVLKQIFGENISEKQRKVWITIQQRQYELEAEEILSRL